MKKNKKVGFHPKNEYCFEYLPHPNISKNYFPDWLKNIPSVIKSNIVNRDLPGPKHCMPFMDTFNIGYIQELHCDIEIKKIGKDEKQKDIIEYFWTGKIKPMSTRKEDFGTDIPFPKFNGFYNSEFHWLTTWEPVTPKGYFTLYFHPLNRFDLPFQTFSGAIDTDKFNQTGPLPFLIKENFEGIIPAGTPIYQFVFIKKENWKFFKMFYNQKFSEKQTRAVEKKFLGGYKKSFWQKKQYN